MSTERLKVWVATPELHRHGGTERCLAEQIERWRERFDLRLYTMRVAGVDVRGIAVRRIPWLPGPHLFRYVWWFIANTLVRAWDARRLGRPDVVHAPGINCPDADIMSVHMIYSKYWAHAGRAATGELRKPRFALRAAHRLAYWRLICLLEETIYSGPAAVWAISRRDAEELETRCRRPPGSVPALPHGVDTRQFCPQRRGERRLPARRRLGVGGMRVVLLVGNDARKKGVDAAVRALSFLPRDVVLAVAGRMDEAMVRSWAREENANDRVLLWPPTPKVLDYYAAADVFVAPSREDAFHLPALEALACGLPVVVSAAAGAAELMQDGRHALILRNTADPAECAGLLDRILQNPPLAACLAVEGRALAERYSWSANADQAAALIEREAATPRVLVLAPDTWGMGGIQRATRTLLQALTELYGPDRVGLLTIWGPSAPLSCRVLWAGPSSRGTARVPVPVKMRFAAAAAMAARRWRRRLVIVACHPHLAPVARACARVSGAPFIVWCHGQESWRPQRRVVRRALREAHAVVSPSRFTASVVQKTAGTDDRRFVVLPHAISREVPLAVGVRPQPGSKSRVLSVARLAPEDRYKGIDTLLTVWPRVLEAIPQAELQIVGDGADRPRLEAEAGHLGLNGQVRFAGALDDAALARAYGEAAVFALPARTVLGGQAAGEGFGLVYLEAAAAGLPVVAGNGGAIPEVVRDGETGLLVDPRAPDEVAGAIVRLLRDPGLACRMGEAAQRRALEEFSFERFRWRLGELVAQVRGQA